MIKEGGYLQWGSNTFIIESDTKSIHVFDRPSCRLGPSFQLLVIQRIFTFSKKIWQKEIIGQFVVRSSKKDLYYLISFDLNQ